MQVNRWLQLSHLWLRMISAAAVLFLMLWKLDRDERDDQLMQYIPNLYRKIEQMYTIVTLHYYALLDVTLLGYCSEGEFFVELDVNLEVNTYEIMIQQHIGTKAVQRFQYIRWLILFSSILESTRLDRFITQVQQLREHLFLHNEPVSFSNTNDRILNISLTSYKTRTSYKDMFVPESWQTITQQVVLTDLIDFITHVSLLPSSSSICMWTKESKNLS